MSLIKVKLEGAPAPGTTRRKLNAAMKASMLAVGYFWTARMLKKHFTPAGAREYHFADRTAGYQIAKAKLRGNQNPLMWSGRSLASALGHDGITATATANRARVRVPILAPALNRMGKRRIDMAAEVIAVSDGDTRLLSAELQNVIGREFKHTLEA